MSREQLGHMFNSIAHRAASIRWLGIDNAYSRYLDKIADVFEALAHGKNYLGNVGVGG